MQEKIDKPGGISEPIYIRKTLAVELFREGKLSRDHHVEGAIA